MRIGGSSDWIGGSVGPRPTKQLDRAPDGGAARGGGGDVAQLATLGQVARSDRSVAEPAPPVELLGRRPENQEAVQEPGQEPGIAAQHEAPVGDRSADPRDGTTKAAGERPDGPRAPGDDQLSAEEQAEVAELRRRDAEVRAHEAAHAAAAGAFGGGASFEYTTGPDGRNYAVAGEVSVQISPGRTPEETIRNAAQVRSAALAPGHPSAQDRAVAAEASAIEAAARAQIAARAGAASPAPRSQPVLRAPGAEAVEETATTGAAAETAADTEMMIRELELEQRTARAGWRHLHSSSGCGGCGQAVAAYR